MSATRRVVITGLGIVSSIGQGLAAYWESLVAGRSGIKPIAAFDTTDFTTTIAGEIPDFDPKKWLDKRTANRLDRFTQLGLCAAIQAVTDAGISYDREDPSRCGAMIGTGIGGLWETETQMRRLIEKGPARVSPFLVPKMMPNACSGQVSIYYGFNGPNFAGVSACASANHSIGQAFRAIVHDDADVMIAGGAEAAITPLGLAGFCAARALSIRNDEPERASRPFDRDRDGFVMGEGAGIAVLEELEHARRRGANILAEVLGFGMSGDGVHLVEPDPEGSGAALSMTSAMRFAQVNPQDISFINAHGTATVLGDKTEIVAIKRAFGDAAGSVAVNSTKSMIGHLLGASGGVELVACVMCLRNNVVHPTINLENPDPECDLDCIPNQAREMVVEKVLSNSFGFGGHNASLLIGKFSG